MFANKKGEFAGKSRVMSPPSLVNADSLDPSLGLVDQWLPFSDTA
jgi:hypothetical protein